MVKREFPLPPSTVVHQFGKTSDVTVCGLPMTRGHLGPVTCPDCLRMLGLVPETVIGRIAGVLWVPIRCGKCGSKRKSTYTVRPPTRWHTCRDCGNVYKSSEIELGPPGVPAP